jgi:hypothetical protein
MDTELTLREQADAAMVEALAAERFERYALMEEALRLHRLACAADELKHDPNNLLATDPEG